MCDLKLTTPGLATTAGPGALRHPRKTRNLRRTVELTVLLGPALVLFLGFVLLPIVIAAYYSLFNWSGYGPLSDFTGLHNYKIAFGDPVFVQAIEHTLILTGLSLYHGLGSHLLAVAGVGLCGGYTTWSTAGWESVHLLRTGYRAGAAIYTFGGLAVCLGAAAAGLGLMALA